MILREGSLTPSVRSKLLISTIRFHAAFESQGMMEGLTHVLVTVISILRSELAFIPFGTAAGVGPE